MLAAMVALPALAAPPTARQAAEDEALVRRLVEARLSPLVAEWRDRAAGDAALRERLDLALLEIRVAVDSPAARLAEVVPGRRALVERAVAAGDPRRAAWSLDLASDLLVASPALDGRVATLAVGIADRASIARWRAELDEADAALALANAAIAETPRGPLALPEARDFRRGWEGRAAALAAIAAGTRALLEGKTPVATAGELPPGTDGNDLALLSALAAGPEALRSLAADSARGPWINLAAECALDLSADDERGRDRLADRAARLARDRSLSLALLSADVAVRAAPADGPDRFTAWETLLDATPAARRGAMRGAIFAKLESLPPGAELATMGDFELAARSLAGPAPGDLDAPVAARAESIGITPREATRLLGFARLRGQAARGELADAAVRAERLAVSLGDDPIAAAAAETLVLVRAALAAASTDGHAARSEQEALELAIGRFPRSAAHDRWAIDLALARLEAGETKAAIEATRRVPDGSPLGPEARAVEAFALVRDGDAASMSRAEALVRGLAAAGDPTVAARRDLAIASLAARGGRLDDARATAEAIVRDAALSAPIRADALRLLLELGATPPESATREILAARPRARAPLLAALAATGDRERTRRLLAALANARDALAPDERLAVARATLATGDADAAARLASEAIAELPRESPAALAATLVRAESLRALGGEANLAEAFTLGREVARAAPQASPAWWEANALQLEILAASGRNRDQVGPWVNRLKTVDPQLGGPAIRARIEAVTTRARP